MRPFSFILWFLSLSLWTVGNASHFRGGTISWKHLGRSGNSHNILVDFRFAWRRDYSSPGCDATAIQNQAQGYGSGSWTSYSTTFSSPNLTTSVICTAYDITENWMYGYNSYVANVTSTGPFDITYTGNVWISATYGSGSWALKAGNIDFDIRSDTGLVNYPPTVFSTPVIELKQGCARTITIMHQDIDNDRVTCRYAVSGKSPDECSSACNGPSSAGYSHFTLNQAACTIDYDGGGATGPIVVSLVLSDHPRTNIVLGGSRSVSTSDVLSEIPLQFIMQIDSSSTCNVVPTYPSQSIQNGDQIAVYGNGVFNKTLLAYSSDTSTSITQFIILGPLGMQTSAIVYLGSNLYSATLSWNPMTSQGGTHNVCYYAKDSSGTGGSTVCFTVTVANTDLCAINNGGCSDICTWSGTSATCSCSLPCWRLDLDGATCVPNMAISCDGDGIQIAVSDCASNRTVVAGNTNEHIARNECQSTHVGNQHVLNWNASTCGLDLAVNPVQVQYTGNLWVWHGIDTSSSVIVRGEYRNVPVTCTLSSTADVSASFVPQLPLNNESFPIDVSFEGFGQFSLYFEFYRNSAYSSVVSPSEYPISVTVNDRIYFAVGAIGQPGFTFFAQECEAVTSAPDPSQPPLRYTFLRNGCFVDPTLIRYPSNNSMEERMSLEAFDFAQKITSSRLNADISLQCQVMICDAFNATARCFQGCLSSRKKRSIGTRQRRDDDDDDDFTAARPNDRQSPLQDLKGRFILVGDLDSLNVNSGESPNYLYWALIAIGILALLVALFVAYRLLKLKKSRPTKELSQVDFGHQNKGVHLDI